jgi:hypothetical protein
MRQQLGHDGPPTGIWSENLMTDAPLTECPLRTLLRAREEQPVLMQELDRYRDTYYPAYNDGHLLVAGGIADQPARYLDIVMALRTNEERMQRKFEETEAMNGDGAGDEAGA